MERLRHQGESKHIISVGLVTEKSKTLYKIDISVTIEETIKQICYDFDLLYSQGERGLWTDKFIDNTAYVSDNNKNLILPGSMLYLQESPVKAAHTMIDKLLKDNVNDFDTFLKGAEDIVLLKTLHDANAHEVVYGVLDATLSSDIYFCGLRFINRLYTHRLIRRVSKRIVEKMFEFILNWDKTTKDLVLESMSLLCEIRRNGRLRYKESIFENLTDCIQKCTDTDLQTASLKLLNYLVIFPNNCEDELIALRHIVNERMVKCIYNEMVTGPGSKFLQQQLYQYQALTIRRYWEKKVTKVRSNDPIMKTLPDVTDEVRRGSPERRRFLSEHQDNLPDPVSPRVMLSTIMSNLKSSFRWPKKEGKLIAQIACDSCNTRDLSATIRPDKMKKSPHSKDVRKGAKFYSCIADLDSTDDGHDHSKQIDFEFYGPFQFVTESGEDIYIPTMGNMSRSLSTSAISTPTSLSTEASRPSGRSDSKEPKFSVSLLTVENLKYLAKHDPRQYHKWCLTKRKRHEFADQVTQMLCRLLEVGRTRSVDDPADGFHPLLFNTYPHFLEILFGEALRLHDKTGKEMKARVDSDIPKVLAIMKRQLSSALNAKPQDLKALWEHLNATPYEVIELKIQAEIKERVQHDLAHKPLFLEFRETCRLDVERLVIRQRMSFMLSGQHLPKVNFRGDIVKNTFQCLVLDYSKKRLFTRDCTFQNCKNCSHENDVKVIETADILEVSLGKRSQFYMEIAMNFSEQDPFFRPRVNNVEPQHWARLFSFKMSDDSFYHFCAPDETSLHQWLDGINLLIGKPMSSPSAIEDRNSLLDMEVRLHFLDIEGIPVPDLPPELPPPPPNYNFHARIKTRL